MKKLYLLIITVLIVAAANAQAWKVAVVSSDLPDADAILQKVIDEIEGMDGLNEYTAEHFPLTNLTASANLTNYDAYVLTENGTSGSYANFNANGWNVPVVILKTYMIYQGTNPILTQNPDTWKTANKVADLTPGMNQLKVINNDDILKCWEADATVTWTDGYNEDPSLSTGLGEGHVQAFNLAAPVNPIADVVAAAEVLAETLDETMTALPTFMWKVEETGSTKRMVIWGVHDGLMEKATDDFYLILKNSVKWVLNNEGDMNCGETGFKDLTSARFQVYPNPVAGKLNINSAGLINSVNLVDITGKIMMKLQDVNEQTLQIDMSNLSKGLYVIHMTTVDGETFTGKVSK